VTTPVPRPLFQFPNKPLTVVLVARAVALGVGEEAGRGLRNLSNVALLMWGYEEATEGANWFRHLIGLGGVAYSAGSLVTRW
jgi:hypothetical protein